MASTVWNVSKYGVSFGLNTERYFVIEMTTVFNEF